jgi:hypothetical protein
MKAWLTRISEDIKRGENVDLYLVLVAAVGLVGLDLIGVGSGTTTWVITVNMAVLTLIALSLLGNRHRLERIEKKLDQSPEGVFLAAYPDTLRGDMRRAKTLWMVGQNLSTTTNRYRPDVLYLLKQGGSIRFMVINPNSSANQAATQRVYQYTDETHHQDLVHTSLALMRGLQKEYGSRVDIRTSDYVPSLGFLGIDIDEQNGVMYIETYPYKLEVGDVPRFVIRPHDGAAYGWFKQHLLNWWEDGKPWVTPAGNTTEKADPASKPAA